MHNPIFSNEDKVMFFDVVKDINEHLHHVKQYDKLEDVLRYAQRFEKEMKELAKLYKDFLENKKLLQSIEEEEEEDKKADLLEYIIDVFRKEKNWDAVSHKFKKSLKLNKLGITLDQEVRNGLESMWQKWKELTIEFDIIIQKIKEIQVDRSRYFALLKEQLNQINQNINNLKFELRQKITLLDNLLEEKIEESKKVPIDEEGIKEPKEEPINEEGIKDKILQLISVFIDIRSKMNNLQIERNKMKGIAPIYPAFIHNLQQPISESIRGKHLEPNLNVTEKWENVLKKNGISPQNEKSNDSREVPAEPNSWVGCDTDQKKNIAYRAITILNRLDNKNLDYLNEKLQEIGIKTWQQLKKDIINIKKEDSSDRISFTRTSLSNNLIEEANFHYLLKLLRTEVYRIFRAVYLKKFGKEKELESFSKLMDFNGEDLWEQVKIVETILNSDKVNYIELYNGLIDAINKKKKIAVDNNKGFVQTVKDELAYYIRCTKEHAKIYNNRVFADFPTRYEPYEIKNTILQHQLKDKGFLFSSKFRKVLKQIDKFLEHSFFDYLLQAPEEKNDWQMEEYKTMYNYIQRKLESLRIGQYDVLNEYLHSQKFIAATDRIQLYSGSFGIWNQEAEELVRLQDRRYCQTDYRPLSQGANQWFDLNDRIYNGEYWETNAFEESIDLMFLTVKDRTQIYPEFYQNLSADNNFLNQIEKDNNCVFCEDGEISAFTLLYRFLNTIFHSKLSHKEKDSSFLKSIESAKEIKDLNKTSDKIGKDKEKALSSKRLASAIFYYLKPNELFKVIIDSKGALENTTEPVGKEKREEINKKPEIQYFYEEKKLFENEELKKRFKKQDLRSPYLSFFLLEFVKKINECNNKIRFDPKDEEKDKFNALELKVWKYLLKEFIGGLLECWNKEDCEFHFEQKKLPINISKDSYDKHEATARREKFYNDIHHRIPKKVNTLLTELTTQGLLDKSNLIRAKEDRWDTPYLKITERYVNLCKFIDREFNENKRNLKVKCNFDPQLSPVSPDKYFIDTKIEELSHNEHAKQYRINEVRSLLRSIKDVVEDNYNLSKISKSAIADQLAQILCITLESITPFLCSNNFQDKYKNFLGEVEKNESSLIEAETKESSLKRGIDLIWSEVKDRIDEISKFPISPWFVWRANGFHALSHLVLPIASTAIKPESPNTGFFIMGVRNVIEDHKGRTVHITNETEEYFTELIYTIRSIFQPLIHPFMDKIYYGQIINKTVQDNAVRAGVARVMSRNLSHNIGSHILEKLARDPEISIADRQVFDHYLRTRMAFIADISTGKPYLAVPSKLREGILLDFQPNSSELTKETDENQGHTTNNIYQKILLRYISGEFEMTDDNTITIQLDKGLEDIDFALPNSQLGAHAFYVILENIIRNAFKHANTDKVANHALKLTLRYDKLEDNEKLYKLSIIDNFGEITENRDEELKKDLQKYLDHPITDPKTRKLQLEYWGMVEMKIAAAYLRQLDVIEIDTVQSNKSKYPLLEVDLLEEDLLEEIIINEEKIENTRKINNLCYNLYLQVPMLLEIIFLNSSSRINSQEQKNWLNHGINIVEKEVIKSKQGDYFPETNYPFQLFIYSKNQNDPIKDLSININTFRIESFSKDKEESKTAIALLKKGPIKNTINELMILVWGKRKRRLLEENKYKPENEHQLCIFDSQGAETDHTDLISGKPYPKERIKANNESFFRDHIFFGDHDKLRDEFQSRSPMEILYYETYGSVDSTNFLLKEIKKFKKQDYARKHILDEIIESAFTDIGILDERIQTDIDRYKGINEKRSRGALERVKVFIPQKNKTNTQDEQSEPQSIYIDLQKVNKSDNSINYEQLIREWINGISYKNRDKRPLDFLIIHIRVIEKLVGTKKESIEDFINKLKKEYSYTMQEEEKEKVIVLGPFEGQIIITSGRGVPSNIPPKVPFIPFAVLGRFLFEQPSKFTLTKLLFSATMKGGIHE